MNTGLLAAVDVGSAPQVTTSAPVEPAIDSAARARCQELVEWRLGEFLAQLQEMSPAYSACMTTIVLERLAPYMEAQPAEELLKALARRVVLDRQSRKESRAP